MPGLWVRAVRILLALAFLNYGIAKLANIQFNPAYFSSAFENVPADQLSGFQLTWRYFAHSRIYQCLIGLAEVGPAILLLFSRTALVGALAYLPVILNVVLVDLCFRIAPGPTMVALTLLSGNLLLLVADRHRIGRAFAALTHSAGDIAAQGSSWRRLLLGWGLGLALLGGLTIIATLIDKPH
jgi:hypothetical protein